MDTTETGIFVSEGEKFQPAPAGFHRGVCIDVVDLGMVPSQFGTKRKILVVWAVEVLREDGQPFIVAKRYTASLDKKATLRKDLRSWRGADFTPEEVSRFNLEKLLGQPCMLQVIHNTHDGETYANVEVVTPPTPPYLAVPTTYVRRKDRPADEKKGGGKPAATYTQPAQAAQTQPAQPAAAMPPAGMVTPNQLAAAGAAAGARF